MPRPFCPRCGLAMARVLPTTRTQCLGEHCRTLIDGIPPHRVLVDSGDGMAAVAVARRLRGRFCRYGKSALAKNKPT
ncbi:hypothetical protein B0T18DRAFT_96561 [Schizothecium vesticola]|uniref:Uncharacterized protein n=1 Tax=Schizothecium vesticola TaxID=314040 RepID=A0AA40F0U2_9PEZI|nr:hypothetical protein B0T18DRAFT_96561 [Schizothecium vesticola]